MPLPNLCCRYSGFSLPNVGRAVRAHALWITNCLGGHKKAYFGQMGGLFYVKFQDLQLSYSMASVYLQNWRSFPHKNTFFCCFYVENFFSFEDRHLPLSKEVVDLEILHRIDPPTIQNRLFCDPQGSKCGPCARARAFGKEKSEYRQHKFGKGIVPGWNM